MSLFIYGCVSMSKFRVFITLFVALIVVFNVVLSVGFVLASHYLFGYLNSEINSVSYNDQTGLYVIPYIHFSGFEVQVGGVIYEDGQVVNLGPLPDVILNYPYILFWVSVIGNIVLVGLMALFLYRANFRIQKRIESKIS
jgi:hypothetical protein